MRKTTKSAFTLVELIVVITILAVLGTIAFISLQGYSADARNSKRTSDVNNIQSAMSIKQAEGGSLTAFVTADADTRVSTSSYGGTGSTATTYFAGIPNYTALGVKAEEFQDPNGQDYRMGITTTAGGRFELAASLENGADREALVKGTYVARALSNSGAIAQVSGKVVTLEAASTNTFSSGDHVDVYSSTGTLLNDDITISKVARDGISITFPSTISTTAAWIDLNAAETAGLVSIRGGTSTTAVSNGTLGAANQAY